MVGRNIVVAYTKRQPLHETNSPPTLTTMEDLDRHGGVADVEFAMEKRRRNAVVVVLDLHVVIDMNALLFPRGEDVGWGWQRPQDRPIHLLEARGAAPFEFPKRPMIEPLQQFGDG